MLFEICVSYSLLVGDARFTGGENLWFSIEDDQKKVGMVEDLKKRYLRKKGREFL